MKTINRITLIGNICTDPVLQSGRLLFRLATNREERQGKDRDIHQIVARSAGPGDIQVATGDRVYIEGRLQYHAKDPTKPEIFAYSITKI